MQELPAFRVAGLHERVPRLRVRPAPASGESHPHPGGPRRQHPAHLPRHTPHLPRQPPGRAASRRQNDVLSRVRTQYGVTDAAL